MEKSVDGLYEIKEIFDCKEQDIRSFSPLTLAYIGDAVYDLVIRTIVVERGNKAANVLHKTTVKYVNAAAQAAIIQAVLDVMTEEELAVYMRGRNAKSNTMAKNASVEDYRKATGMEALIGYLYLSNRFHRVLELVKLGMEKAGYEI
ncbi:MAG: ribonuclease III [Lachnospiraceae bacterium]|jgi:ribonuclease-3 family protein|nr:ribonuclease III [Lachnospiraceae bacterium]